MNVAYVAYVALTRTQFVEQTPPPITPRKSHSTRISLSQPSPPTKADDSDGDEEIQEAKRRSLEDISPLKPGQSSRDSTSTLSDGDEDYQEAKRRSLEDISPLKPGQPSRDSTSSLSDFDEDIQEAKRRSLEDMSPPKPGQSSRDITMTLSQPSPAKKADDSDHSSDELWEALVDDEPEKPGQSLRDQLVRMPCSDFYGWLTLSQDFPQESEVKAEPVRGNPVTANEAEVSTQVRRIPFRSS